MLESILVHCSAKSPEVFVTSTHFYSFVKRDKCYIGKGWTRHTDLKFDAFSQLSHHTPKLDQYFTLNPEQRLKSCA